MFDRYLINQLLIKQYAMNTVTNTRSMKLVMSLSSLYSQLIKKLDLRLSIHGISFTEYLVLSNLDSAPNKTMRRIDLAESIGLTASGVTRMLAPMEKIHLVQKEKNPRDARVSLVKLSDAGEQIYRDASISFQESAEQLIQPLNDKQLDQLLRLVELV